MVLEWTSSSRPEEAIAYSRTAIVGVWFGAGASFWRRQSFTQATDYQDLRWPRRLEPICVKI